MLMFHHSLICNPGKSDVWGGATKVDSVGQWEPPVNVLQIGG